MQNKSRNIYQAARESAGRTQEAAAEQLACSVRSLCDYEAGVRPPPDDIVVRMVQVYDAQYLAYQHMLLAQQVAQMVLPPISVVGIAQATVGFVVKYRDLASIADDLLRIAADGVVDDNERPRFDEIVADLKSMAAQIYQITYAETENRK